MLSSTGFKTAIEFSKYIEEQALANNTTVIATIIKFANEHGVEFESIKPMLADSCKDKLYENGVELGYIQQHATLDRFFDE